MAQDWLADVRKYVADADEAVVAKIVRYCGIALRNVDSSLVAFSDAKETGRVRQNYLKKKLGLTQDDVTLDAAIAAVGERMKADRTKNRVTVYYLLAEHFDRLDLFGGAKRGGGAGGGAGAAVAGGAMGLAAMTQTSSAVAAEPVAAPVADVASVAPAVVAVEPVALKAAPVGGGSRDDDGYFAWGCGAALVLIGAIIVAALLAWAADRPAAEAVAPPAAVAVPVAPAPAAPQAVPDGAGVIAGERDAKPMLTVYFDTGKADVIADFAAAAAPVLAYLEANPGATLAISGYNDPTGNAAANAELSKNRAQNVQAAIVALGVAEARARLEKPAETTSTGMSDSEARRVEVVVVDG